jgi:prevent-host-death family protein
MGQVASRELRNHTAGVLERVQNGEVIEVTVHGRVVAELRPVQQQRPRYWTKAELLDVLRHHQADPGLRDDLAELNAGSTDDLDDLDGLD